MLTTRSDVMLHRKDNSSLPCGSFGRKMRRIKMIRYTYSVEEASVKETSLLAFSGLELLIFPDPWRMGFPQKTSQQPQKLYSTFLCSAPFYWNYFLSPRWYGLSGAYQNERALLYLYTAHTHKHKQPFYRLSITSVWLAEENLCAIAGHNGSNHGASVGGKGGSPALR